MLGYQIVSELYSQLPGYDIAALITLVVVDQNDNALKNPTKPVGPLYEKKEANILHNEFGWTLQKTDNGYQRLIGSPVPENILEIGVIARLIDSGILVVCAGGGGIPVVRRNHGYAGVDAVVDKDRSAAFLAEKINADWLVLLTDIDAVYGNWNSDSKYPIQHVSPETLLNLKFEEGIMKPKVESACHFALSGGTAGIGDLESIHEILNQEKGTVISSAYE